MEPDSVILRDPAGRTLQIFEQNYRNDPVSQELLLSFYEGKTIEFQVQPGQIIKGKIIRSGYVPSYSYSNGYQQQPAYSQPIIEVDGVLRFGLPGQPLFPALSGDSILKPMLSWLLETDKPGAFEAELSYVSGGMNWHADYNLVAWPTAEPDQPRRSGRMDHHAESERQDFRERADQADGGRCKQAPCPQAFRWP